jgi:hypothetical protein
MGNLAPVNAVISKAAGLSTAPERIKA